MSADALMSRVLLVSSLQIHPTLSGGNLRTFALANALASRGAEVFVYSFVGRKQDYLSRVRSGVQRWPSGVQEYVNRSVPTLLAGYGSYAVGVPPLWLSGYLWAGGAMARDWLLPRVLRDRLAWCDAVIADFPFVHPIFSARAARGKLRVLNTHNVEHHLYDLRAGWRSRALRRAVRRVELSAAEHADVVVSCSADDQSFFEKSSRLRHAVVVPNGIDVERFSMSPDVRRLTRKSLGFSDSTLVVLFTASKWGPNQEAFEFLRNFATSHEQELVENSIHFLVVGSVGESPLRLPALTATGRVEAVEPYFAAADVGINPMVTGAGTNVKMCEFIAARLPVLVTPFGARGYRIEHRRSGFVFDRPRLMAALRDVQCMLAGRAREVRAMTEVAFSENAGVVSMAECVGPLLAVLGERSATTGAPPDVMRSSQGCRNPV